MKLPSLLQRVHYNSPVILTVALLSLVTLILNTLTAGITNALFFTVYSSPLSDPFSYIRLFGHIIGHSGYAHFSGNMLFLLVIGPPMEEKYGSKTLLVGILATALLSGILQCLLFPGVGLLGASGIVFMLIMLSSLSGMRSGDIPLTLILVAIFYLGEEVYNAIFVQDGVSQFAHIIGGLAGTAFGYIVDARKNKPQSTTLPL